MLAANLCWHCKLYPSVNLKKLEIMTANSMMTSVRNNLNQLPKRDKFKNRLGGYNSEKRTEYNLPKASTKQLNDIRKRLKEERTNRMMKVIVLTIVLFIGLCCLFVFCADGLRDSLWF